MPPQLRLKVRAHLNVEGMQPIFMFTVATGSMDGEELTEMC